MVKTSAIKETMNIAIAATFGILRRYALNADVRKLCVKANGEVWLYKGLAGEFTGEYLTEDEIWRITWAVKSLPESALKKIRGTWEARKFEAFFSNGWRLYMRKTRMWHQHKIRLVKKPLSF